MKKFYSRFRIFLLTFAFGLACVSFSNGIYNKQSTVSLDVPQITFELPIVVYPKYKSEMGELPYFPENEASGHGGGGGTEDKEVEKNVKKDRRK